ncbi:unnamed protein product [Orchesella dallaii]|uniref:RING-type E3 ubiquitin transferase n=1 Tax=Orchesella dallaii TaxID=48710 RepID=A0ABP1PS20_9HEXA
MKKKRGGGRGRGRGRPAKGAENTTSESGNASTVTEPDPQSLKLATKPGKLTRQDVTCPICWSILIEPTTLPCYHSLCKVCFKKHVDETALSCPCCRLRLSVWIRKVVKENKLLDEELWTRIKNEFPKLVAARLNGEDSQDILDDEDEPPSLTPNSPSLLETSSNLVRDGTICENPGEIRVELQQLMNQHEKDVEIERLREETASADLIKQLQEEETQQKTRQLHSEEQDFLIAKKIQDELRAEELNAKSSSTITARRNLMNEWVNSSANSTSKTAGRKATPGSSKSSGRQPARRLSGGKKTPTSRKSLNSSMEYSKASQSVMTKFLSSQSQHTTPTDRQNAFNCSESSSSFFEVSPCCSKSIPNHDISFSAFSPTKASRNSSFDTPNKSSVTLGDLPPAPMESSESWNFGVKVIEDTSTKTPDSIKSEVDRHFRPIRSAPKTPPRRRADGTFLPEPKLVRTTPIRPSTSASSYSGSPVKQNCDNNKPSCATAEKRISNDSGRGSDDTDESTSPDVQQITSPAYSLKGSDPIVPSNFNTQSESNERGCTSEDYRVTPESDDAIPGSASDKQKKRPQVDEIIGSSPCKRSKVTGINVLCTPNKSTNNSNNQPVVKEEPLSPSILSDRFYGSPCSSSGSIVVEENHKYLAAEAEALALYQKKIEQEAADREFAKSLQRSYDRGISSPRGRNSKERYSLRNWLKPKVKQEVKIEINSDD